MSIATIIVAVLQVLTMLALAFVLALIVPWDHKDAAKTDMWRRNKGDWF